MELDLSGKVAVVSGASRGIGLAVTKALVTEGVRVVAGARHTSPDLANEVASGHVTVVEGDLGERAACDQLIETVGSPIDILVNNVGGAVARIGGFAGVTDEEWIATLNLDLMAAVRIARRALPHMMAAGGGSIVNISSVNSTLSDPLVVDYCAAKAAVASFSKSLAKELAPSRIPREHHQPRAGGNRPVAG